MSRFHGLALAALEADDVEPVLHFEPEDSELESPWATKLRGMAGVSGACGNARRPADSDASLSSLFEPPPRASRGPVGAGDK